MRISVALCTFNGEKYLREQLFSIAQQTIVPDDVVILDDRSEDHTVEVARAVCRECALPATIEVNSERYGPDKNFSRALERAGGDIVFFCDQDDVWMAERVAKMTEPFREDENVSLVYSNGYITSADLAHTGLTLFEHGGAKKNLPAGDAREVGRWLQQGRNPGVKASAMAFRSSVKELACPLPESVGHDAWLAYLGYACGNVVALEEPLYLYRRHRDTYGASSTNIEVGEDRSGTSAGDYAERIERRAHLATALWKRMGHVESVLERQDEGRERYARLYNDAAQAASMLERRIDVMHEGRRFCRLFKGVRAWVSGAYSAYPGYRAQLQCLKKDMEFRA